MAAPAPQCNCLVFFRDRPSLSLLARAPARQSGERGEASAREQPFTS